MTLGTPKRNSTLSFENITMSAFPLPVSGYPNLATTQLLMSAANGLNLSMAAGATSPKDLALSSSSSLPLLGGRVPGLPEFASPGQAANFIPNTMLMADPRFLYSALGGAYDVKENADALMAWRHLAAQAHAASSGMLAYDAHTAAMAAAFPYAGYPTVDINGVRRKNATRETTSTLKAWLYEHRKNPYPTKGEKIMLAIITKMTLTQVSTWFANARRRLKKENKMTWSPRNRTDNGSDDGDDKQDDDDDAGDGDDVSIDLSDFETDSSSPLKPAMASTSSSEIDASKTHPANSSSSISNKDSNKPRIWSIADVAASKPSVIQSNTIPTYHQTPSVRHRPYPVPSSAGFRPWFESCRPMPAHPALGNPFLQQSRQATNISSLRVPLSSNLTQIPVSHKSPTLENTSTDKNVPHIFKEERNEDGDTNTNSSVRSENQ